jgi:hypothetical protein
MNYAQADSKLQGRNYLSRKLANNTYLVRREEDIAVKLHQTDVVTFKPNGDTVLDSGGWHTVTTKDRMNNYGNGLRLWQEKGRWFVGDYVAYADGMVIKADGSISGAGEYQPATDKAMKRRIKAYAAICAKDLPLDLPGPGDCWFCLMFEKAGMGDTEHFLSHMEEEYVVPTLVFEAMKSCGYDPQRNMQFALVFDNPMYGRDTKFAEDTVRRTVYRYLSKKLGFAV